MKPFPSALLLAVCLALAGNVPAYARSTAHSGTSSSFKSGFSSQKSNSARHSKPSAPPANRQSGPGAFGQQAGSPAQPPRNTSALSRDVDQSAARANALKTLDQRRAAANNQPLPPLNDTLRQPSSAQPPSPVYRAPAYPAPGPGYQQQSSGGGNGLMAGVMGFMLGRAMSQSHQPVAYPTTSGQQPSPQPAAAATTPAGPTMPSTAGAAGNAAPADGAVVTGMPGLAAPSPAVAPSAAVPAVAPQPSFFMSVLRWFAWLCLLSLLAWTAVYSVRKFRRLRAAPNYSFERN
ncbi:hypothetical protein FHW58_003802 [Duganella sp. 1224]|uniref:hypothetical protein n=1 Tax=Duganella sp. 1224 TaxID=2587052 RepID=UPI0015CECED9|nr:hypothetical protein [Duganella sp. 1224]NYE62583.1 hypothetical protein [Duganella sp. 1224]